MIYEVKKFLDTNIYRSFNILRDNYAQYFKNFPKYYAQSIGIALNNMITKCIENMSLSYYQKSKSDKLQYALKTKELLFLIEINFKGLYESYKCVSEKQYALLCRICGNIEEQLYKWIDKCSI